MSTLIAITYDTADKATQALEKLGELQKMQLVTLEDAAVAVKDQKGKVKVTQTLENMHTGSAALWGGFWGLWCCFWRDPRRYSRTILGESVSSHCIIGT